MVSDASNNVLQEKLSNFYGESFYESQMDRSYRSASKYTDFLFSLFTPESVVDLGCGRGTWLKAFKDKGVRKLVGYDGPWNDQANMVDKSIIFRGIDLNNALELVHNEKYDLAISLEVAEHLEELSATDFAGSLVKLSDVVMFGAAYIQQGGMNHINEQPHTYWASIFQEKNYVPYDLFRPVFWGDPEIDFWYQQNTFLYVKKGCSLVHRLSNLGYEPLRNIQFMNCVHPSLYDRKILQATTGQTNRRVASTAVSLPPSLLLRGPSRNGSSLDRCHGCVC